MIRKSYHSYLLYLDLILHNTSPADLASRCREALPRIEDGRFLCHPTAITCGLPSVLRGERDLSDFFLPATAAPDKSVRLVVDHALGRHSVGLEDLLQAEHLLEQGEDIAHLLLQWHPLQLRIRDEGTLPSEFVCVALMARSLCAEGQLPEAAAFLLRAGGDSRMASIIDLSCQWVIAVPLTFLTALVFNAPVAVVCLCIQSENVCKCPWGILRLRSRKWINNVTEEGL